jgi:hypothetical protein
MTDKQVVQFEPVSADGEHFFVDGQAMTHACAAEIESGPLKGFWMFSSKHHAEAWCVKNGLTFELAEPTP